MRRFFEVVARWYSRKAGKEVDSHGRAEPKGNGSWYCRASGSLGCGNKFPPYSAVKAGRVAFRVDRPLPSPDDHFIPYPKKHHHGNTLEYPAVGRMCVVSQEIVREMEEDKSEPENEIRGGRWGLCPVAHINGKYVLPLLPGKPGKLVEGPARGRRVRAAGRGAVWRRHVDRLRLPLLSGRRGSMRIACRSSAGGEAGRSTPSPIIC